MFLFWILKEEKKIKKKKKKKKNAVFSDGRCM
jgi:hypothetical protein